MSFYTWPYPPPPEDAVTAVGVQGDRFTINGRVQHIRGFTDFAGFDVFRRTGSLSPLALQLQQVHHDFVSLSVPALSPRILLMKNRGSLFDLDPREMPDFFSKLEHHASLMTQARFIPIYVLLADCADNRMDLGYQRDFVAQACAVLQHHVCLVELVNEYENGPQQVEPLKFDKPAGVCISRGSPGAGGAVPRPDWDWRAPHGRRDQKWLLAIAKDCSAYKEGFDLNGEHWEPWPGPTMDTEPRGAGEHANGRYNSTHEAFGLGLMNALWYHAGVFHCEAGLTSSLLPTNQLNCAITFFRGMMAVPDQQ